MFKPYAIIQTSWGYRPFPATAFMHPDYREKNGSQYLLEFAQDEKLFKLMRPDLAWIIVSANKRGFGTSTYKL